MQSTKNKETIFFAYPKKASGYDGNADAIKAAIQTYNKHQSSKIAKSWEDYKKSALISREILEEIHCCDVFACDLTQLNHNVLFELGFAIALNKKILILLNEGIKNAKATYQDFILKDIRYTPIVSSNEVHKALQQEHFAADLINSFVNTNLSSQIDVFYIQSRNLNQAAMELTNMITACRDKQHFQLVSDVPNEISYRPMNYYLRNIMSAKVILIHMLGADIEPGNNNIELE
ncbi:MAG: hypothetical protein NTW04_05300, partial [Elusimicrobia bacterium]|nr:hypothetical protein [Elusimicrobiota bacterium]